MNKEIKNLLRSEIKLHACRIDELSRLILIHRAEDVHSEIPFEYLDIKNRMIESQKNFRKILDDLNGN